MMTSKETENLLARLCTQLCFCLPPQAREHLCAHPPETPEAFADAVLRAEGMEPARESRWQREISALAGKAFHEASQRSQ